MKNITYKLSKERLAIPSKNGEAKPDEPQYFSTITTRMISHKTHIDGLRQIADGLAIATGIPTETISEIMWDLNLTIEININPGPKLAHITPRSLKRLFEHIIELTKNGIQ